MPRVNPSHAPAVATPGAAAAPLPASGKPQAVVPYAPLTGDALRKAHDLDGMVGRGTGKRILVGELEPGGPKLEITASGKLAIGGKAGGGALVYAAAKLGAGDGGFFKDLPMNAAMRARVLAELTHTLDGALAGKRTIEKEKALSGSISLLVDLIRAAPKSETKLIAAAFDAVCGALIAAKDEEMAAFYLSAMRDVVKGPCAAQPQSYLALRAAVLPERPPVEKWTKNRTKPVEVRHTIHPEFWKEELAYFSKKNGFTLVSKDAKDTEREYTGLVPDPTGKNPPLSVHVKVRKDELDYLEPVSEPDVHVILYSGHSALGGNGSQAIRDSGAMKGATPKLVLAANCRGKDNYAQFTNKFPNAHFITTVNPTYSESGQRRIAALFDTLAAGETYAFMRKRSEKKVWDEPADNYFYPDQMRKFGFGDLDDDGVVDFSALGADRVFDVDLRVAAGKFVRAVNFANSELFYHWEVDLENGKRSFFGRDIGDALVPHGVIEDPKPGEVVRVTPKEITNEKGKKATVFEVAFNPKLARSMDENLYAGEVTRAIVHALSSWKVGQLSVQERLRGVLMGAQAVHYLDVYFETSPKTMKAYCERNGLGKLIDPADVEKIFDKFDAHANNAQVKGFAELLSTKYKLDLAQWHQALS